MGRLLSARTGQPDDPAPDLAASSLSFCLHELHHLMSRRPPEATLSLRRFLVSKSQPWRLLRQFGTSPATARGRASHSPALRRDRLKVQQQGNRPCSCPVLGFPSLCPLLILEFRSFPFLAAAADAAPAPARWARRCCWRFRLKTRGASHDA